jgi:type II secretion system protein H
MMVNSNAKVILPSCDRCRFVNDSRLSNCFTLIELIVVLAIITVAAGAIVPHMARSLEHRTLAEVAGRLAHTARTARELALARQETCTLEIDLAHKCYCVKVVAGESNEAKPIQTSWLKPTSWPETIEANAYAEAEQPAEANVGNMAQPGMLEIRFYPDGTSSGGSVQLVSGDEKFGLVVHPHNGRVLCGQVGSTDFTADQQDLGD